MLGLVTSKFAADVHPLICSWPQFAFMKQRSTFDAIRRVIAHCQQVRTLSHTQRRSVHDRYHQQTCYQVCGGIQILLDANKAFDQVPRQPLFEFLHTLPINQVLVTILTEWHSNTAYLVMDGHTSHRMETGRGVRQGCRAAPVLWSCHTLDLFYQLRDRVDVTWIKKCLTAFADDLHCCDVFYSEIQLRQAISRIGQLLDVLDLMGVQLSLEKSHAIFKISGTNCRAAQRQYIQIDSHGPYINIPRQHGQVSRLPIHFQAKYLGITVGYHQFEHGTVKQRLKAARHTFARLRRWLCARQIPLKTRLQLWHSCIFSTLVYGLYAAGFTLSDVLAIQQCIFSMYRLLLGNHSFLTRQTHLSVLHQYNIDHPLSLLLHAGRQLQRTLSCRLNALPVDDIVWTVDWTHLSSLLHLVQSTWYEQLQAQQRLPADEVLLTPHVCHCCDFKCNSLANLRRHMTTVHGQQQLRTHFTTVASFAVGGLPQCSHCFESFPSWRNFQIHLERNCCQVFKQMTTLPVSPTCPEAQPSAYPKLTNAALTALLSKPYGVEALRNIQQKQWDALQQQPDAIADLTHHCVICGMFCNRPQDLNLHMRTQHPTLLPNVMSKASQLNRAQASNSPCRFCDREFRRTHQCPVMMQAALLLVNTDGTGRSLSQPGDAVLCCDVCNMRFQELMQLHDHLHQTHRLEPQDWDPLRDMLTGTEPVCSHCLSMFADKPALRQHITLGQCRSFDPMRPPAEYPVASEWQELIVSGTIAQLRQAPQKRMHLTLRCQFCHTAFQRTGDLSLHLQTVHSVLWHDSQSHVQLLMEASHTFGCLCNPMTNASGLQHICVALRQLGMMMQKMDQPMFLPWTFEQSHIQTFLQAVLHEPAGQQLRECLRLRQFVTLWTDPLLVQFLRTRCLQCGQSFHPAELREHLHRAHASVMNAQQTLMPQLLTAVGRENANDFHCDMCQQIYNYPPRGDESPQDLSARTLLAQIHLQHQCPVVLQLSLLLQDHGRWHCLHGGGLRDVGNFQDDGSTLQTGQIRETRRRPRVKENQEGRQKARRVQGQPASHGDGSTLAESGCGATSAQASRLMDLLHANRAPGPLAVADSEGSGMEADHQSEAGTHDGSLPFATAMPPHPTPGGNSSPPGHQAGTVQLRGPTEEGSAGTGTADTGGPLPLPEVECASAVPQDHQSSANHHPKDDQVLRAAGRDLEGSMCNSEIPQSQTSLNRSHCALDVANIDAIGRSSSLADNVTREYCMESPWPIPEAPCSPPEQTGSTPPNSDGQRTGQEPGQIQDQALPVTQENTMSQPSRTELLAGISCLRLANDSNWCYVNAAVLTTLWSFLSLAQFSLEQWGPHSTHIANLLLHHDSNPVELATVSFLQPIFEQWQGLGNQGDPVEFLAHLMRGLRFAGINMRWEKRVQIGLLTDVVDESDQYTPLILRFDPAMLQDDMITLCQMIRDWSNQDGMLTALTATTPLICVQIDRHVRSGLGDITKCDIPVNFHWGIDVPFYTDDGMTITWKTYRVIAAIAHLGHDSAGHCRTMLKVAMNATAPNPYMFLLTEDWSKPTPIWKEPSWFLRNITCFWLGDWDQLDFFQLDVTTMLPTMRPPDTGRRLIGASDLLSHFIEGTDDSQ